MASGKQTTSKQETRQNRPRRDGPNHSIEQTDAADAKLPNPDSGSAAAAEPVQILSLPKQSRPPTGSSAVACYLEGVEQARRGEDTLRSVLAMAAAGYSVGGSTLNAAAFSVIPGLLPASRLFPPRSVTRSAGHPHGVRAADLKLQWLICDFGRRMGRYRQAGLA